MYSICELWIFMINIGFHEPGLVDIIQSYMTTYTFHDYEELINAVKIWCCNRTKGLLLYGHISYWDVSQITNMTALFRNKKTFNDDISRWEVGNVRRMNHMFWEAKLFNCNINRWNVENVTDMSWMFGHCTNFSQNLDKWKVDKVTNMNGMFYDAQIFKKNNIISIQKWNNKNASKKHMQDEASLYYIDYGRFSCNE